MNLKTKLRIGAVAGAMLAANSGFAAMAVGGNGVQGNSSMVLVVFDNTSANKITGMFDLGIDYSTFAAGLPYTTTPGQTVTWDLGAGTVGSTVGAPPATTGDWSAAWSAITGARIASDKWFVAAFDNAGIGAGTRGIISTVALGDEGKPATAASAQIPNSGVALNKGMTFFNGLPTNTTATDGASSTTDTAADGFIDNFFGTGINWFNTMPFNASGNYGDSLSFFKLVNTATVTSTQYAGDFKLTSSGVLTYSTAPVPEPSTYALLAAGLVLVAGIARRRLS
jgi:hypothetical protein